jgi:DNA replication protein DnaC
VDDKTYEKLNSIRMNCKLCGGLGYSTTQEDDDIHIVDCVCVTRIKNEIQLIEAGIPLRYRNWTFKDLTQKFKSKNSRSLGIVRNYILNMDKHISNGTGLYFTSQPGLGKSAIICNILKKALKNGYTVYYGLGFELVSLKFRALRQDAEAIATLKNILNNVQILAIEEIEKIYLAAETSMPNQIFNELIINMYDANISLLVSSNAFRPAYEETLPPFIQDRLKNLTSVTFLGSSARVDRRKQG